MAFAFPKILQFGQKLLNPSRIDRALTNIRLIIFGLSYECIWIILCLYCHDRSYPIVGIIPNECLTEMLVQSNLLDIMTTNNLVCVRKLLPFIDGLPSRLDRSSINNTILSLIILQWLLYPQLWLKLITRNLSYKFNILIFKLHSSKKNTIWIVKSAPYNRETCLCSFMWQTLLSV